MTAVAVAESVIATVRRTSNVSPGARLVG